MNSSRPFHSGTRSGFTLIELLTVVAIIGVLAGLVFAIVPNVLRNARQTQCVSNLRQIGLVMNLYASENKGVYPAASNGTLQPNGSTTYQSWWIVIGTYLDRHYSVGNEVQNQVFRCPAAQTTFDPVTPRRTYALNVEGAVDETVPNRVSSNSKPARTLFVIDGAKQGAGPDSYARFRCTGIANITLAADARHGGRFEALFLDGHVAPLDPADPAIPEYVTNWGK